MKYFILILIFCLFSNFNCFGQIKQINNKDFNKFLKALAMVESSNNPKAYNKSENAIGIYQIRKLYFIDAQRINPALQKYKHEDCYRPEVARLVVEAYLSKYSKQQTPEHWAKCHNGGLNYYKKTGRAKNNLEIYWGKINKQSARK